MYVLVCDVFVDIADTVQKSEVFDAKGKLSESPNTFARTHARSYARKHAHTHM